MWKKEKKTRCREEAADRERELGTKSGKGKREAVQGKRRWKGKGNRWNNEMRKKSINVKRKL